VNVNRQERRQHNHRPDAHGILQRRRDPEVDVSAETLLIHATRCDSGQCESEQPHHGVDARNREERTGARGQHRRDTEQQRDNPESSERLAQKHRREHRGHHRVHRDHHGTQHGRRSVFEGQVQADEQHALRQGSAD
jgi:hypothetical protein